MKYPLAETLPYKITQVTTAFNDIVSNWFDKNGASIPVYRALVVLRDGKIRSLKELAQITDIEQSTLSRHVGSMMRSGLITRHRPEENGRIVQIAITEKGNALCNMLTPFVEELEATMLQGISPDVAEDIKSALGQIEDNLNALREKLAADA
jgi:DNA-binding MarR family transcriptional regulator